MMAIWLAVAAGAGSYVIEHHSVDAGFENAAGIRLGGTTEALIHANDVGMQSEGRPNPDRKTPGYRLREPLGQTM
jgi:hypothetical protein